MRHFGLFVLLYVSTILVVDGKISNLNPSKAAFVNNFTLFDTVHIDFDQVVLPMDSVIMMSSCPTSFAQDSFVTELTLECDMIGDTLLIPVWDSLGMMSQSFNLIVGDTTDICTGCTHPDYFNLLKLYELLDGPNWQDQGTNADPESTTAGWLKDCYFCEWVGIECTIEGDVFIIDLKSNNLSGDLPVEIGSFPSLKRLSLGNNFITGSIPPEVGDLAELNNLSLRANQLTGEIPQSLGSLIKLNVLALNRNQLTGVIPQELEALSSLQTLDLSDNQLTGEISEGIGGLENLEVIQLHNNQFTGPLPNSFGDLEFLRELDVNKNQLSGPLPDNIGNPPGLEKLYLSFNDFDSCFPASLMNVCNLGYNEDYDGFYPNSLGLSTEFYSFNGYNLSNNAGMPWFGDMEQWCNGMDQIGAPCDDGNPLNGVDSINIACLCQSQIPCTAMVEIMTSDLCDFQPELIEVEEGFLDYQWTLNGNSIPQNGFSFNNFDVGTYAVTVTDNIGCTATDEVTVTNTFSPLVSIESTGDTICNDPSLGDTHVDFTSFITTQSTGAWNDLDGAGVDLSDLTFVNFNGVPPMIYRFDFITDSAVPPCEDVTVRVLITVVPCGPCDPGGCLTMLPDWTNATDFADVTVDCAMDIPDIGTLDYTNNQPGMCNISGSIDAERETSGFDGCSGILMDFWLATTPCGDQISHSRTITINLIDEPQFISLPDPSITVPCDQVPSLEIPLSYSNNAANLCQIDGEVNPTITGTYNGCGGSITYTWTITSACHNDVVFTQDVTIENLDNVEITIPSLSEAIICDELPLTNTDILITNNLTGPCGIDEVVSPEIEDNVIDCEGSLTFTWDYLDPCTGEMFQETQTVLVRDCGPPILNDDFTEVTVGDNTTINLLDNDILIDENAISIVNIDETLFSQTNLDQDGNFAFLINGNFLDTINVEYQVCDLACDECATALLQLIDDSVVDITLTDVITPNGDGHNDVLRFTEDNVVEGSKLTIFNRWGDKVYESLDYTNDWNADGYPGGIYFYVFRIFGSEVKKTLTVIK